MIEPKEIYRDEKRTASWQPGRVVIHSNVTGKDLPAIPMNALILDAKIQSATVAAIRKGGQNPSGMRVLCRFGNSDLVAPVAVAEVIYREANKLETEYRAELTRIANLPQNKERNEIEALLAKAARIERSDSEDNVWRPAQLRALARDKMREWREKYPEAAKEETRGELLSKASDLRSKAIGALCYDADGWLSKDEQQKRHDDFIAQAETFETKAANL